MLSLREIGLSPSDIKNWFEREIHPKNVKVDGDQIYASCPIPSHNLGMDEEKFHQKKLCTHITTQAEN